MSQKGRPRVLTKEVAEKFAAELNSKIEHNVETAAAVLGIRGKTVNEAIRRYREEECWSDEDNEICGILYRAKMEHVQWLRREGHLYAGDGNRSGTAWQQWVLETFDPLNHPRKTAVEVSGPDGKPLEVKNLSALSDDELRKMVLEGGVDEGED